MPTAERFDFDIEDIPSYFDCDGLTKNALVLPATVRGIIDYLDDCGFDYTGKTAVVLGRSDIVGKPILLEKLGLLQFQVVLTRLGLMKNCLDLKVL